jgi:Protein of unknown function (DUF3108)
MTSPTSSSNWRPLAVVALFVVLAHVLVLQASPAHLGSGPDADDAGAKTMNTRSIEAAPAPQAAAPPVAAAAVKPAKPVKAAQNSPKNTSNKPVAQQNRAQAAPEIVAQAAAASAPEPAVEAAPVPTQPAAATPANTVTTAALPPGPKTTPVNAISLPGSVRLLYKVVGLSKSMNYQANAELAWKTNGDNYDATMKVSAFLVGSRSMTSVGKITGSGLAPTRFADKFRNELAAHFEADKGKITFSANTPDAPWIEGVQDRVSVFLQLGGMLAANPAGFPSGSNITFLTIGPREADTWTFVIEAEETLDLVGAAMPTLKLTRKPRKEFDQKVEIWFAPSLGYLPVRNRITQQNGDFIDQQLSEVVK